MCATTFQFEYINFYRIQGESDKKFSLSRADKLFFTKVKGPASKRAVKWLWRERKRNKNNDIRYRIYVWLIYFMKVEMSRVYFVNENLKQFPFERALNF
jgi:hypothetical protein